MPRFFSKNINALIRICKRGKKAAATASTTWGSARRRVWARARVWVALCLSFGSVAAQTTLPINPFTPPEYVPAKAVLIEWDFNNNTWSLYSQLIAECREATEVICVVRNQGEENDMRQRLLNDGVPAAGISYVYVPCERMWIRDHGPFAIMTDAGMAFMDFDDKANSGMDENLPSNLANLWGLPAYEIPWIFDGGNLMVDGHRTLFCTNGLYLNNPAWPKYALHQDLKQYMGIEKVVLLKPQHNDYWKHIDMQIKLLDDTTFVISSVTPGYSPNYDSLEANYALLASLMAPNGKPYRIARLPHADNWKTYANALILNNRVIVPTYDHPLDSVALAVYADLMPQHIVRGVNCNKIIAWEGALHCITMQLFDDKQVVSLKNQYARSEALRLSPNPAPRDGAITLYADEALHGPAWITLYSADGRLLHTTTERLDERQTLRLHDGLPPGAYLLRVQTADVIHTLRLVVH